MYVSANAAHAGTTTADFLKWERKSQDAFLHNSISMAVVIASQTNQKIAMCLNDWYFKDAKIRKQRNQQILSDMQNFKSYIPQAVILAVIENTCGRYPKN